MNLTFKKAKKTEIDCAFEFFKDAAETMIEKKIDHWQYWVNPPAEKIQWVKDGFKKNEFYFVENEASQRVGMFRLMEEDLLYWGKQAKKARYIHSLVVLNEFSGLKIGCKILQKVENGMLRDNISILRLDCNAANERLCKYYTDWGFVKVGEVQMPLQLCNLYEKELHYC